MAILNFLKQSLNEAFLTGDNYRTEYHKGYAEIFKNPAPKEIKEIAKADNNDDASVRLAMDANGDIYAWIYTILHDEMEDILKKEWVLRFEYAYPTKEIFLGSGTSSEDWETYGSPEVVGKLQRTIPPLTTIKFADANEKDVAWQKELS